MRAATRKWLRRARNFRRVGGKDTPAGQEYRDRFRRLTKFNDAVMGWRA